jgi:nickel/cobalt exporter
MLHQEALGLLVGAVVLGAVHGIEPGHGWPVAAAYAFEQTNKWLYGFAASFIIGVGHLISSLAMVAVFFYAKSHFNLTQVNEPVTILDGIRIGGPVSLVAGVLLIILGIREYTGHSHGDGHSHSVENQANGHEETDHDRIEDAGSHDEHSDSRSELRARIKTLLPFVDGGSHSHGHSHGDFGDTAGRGLLGIAWFAFVLGFAHEEEFEIIALCVGSEHCLELMSAYALTVIFSIVGLTLLLVAGFEHYEGKVERYTPYLPAFSAAVLIIMGVGFITGLL